MEQVVEKDIVKPIDILGNDDKMHKIKLGAYLSFKRNGFVSENDIGEEVLNIYIEPKKKEPEVINAEIFTRKGQALDFISKNPIFYDRSGLFWLWSKEEKFWELTDEVDILNMIEEKLGSDVINSKNRTEILNSLKQSGRKNMPKEADKKLIQFKNGLVHIDNPGELIEPNPSYFITNPLPHNLGTSEDTPTMDRIFTEWVGEEYVQTLYEIIAFCLLGSYPIHRIFCFIGGGLNGKSSYLEMIKRFLGAKNITSTELDTLLSSRFEVTKLHKKLVCMMGETNFNEISKTSILKKLSGGDLIGFEYKNKTPFDENNYAKIIISTNNLPTTSDKTMGFYRRWMIIDFPNQFTEAKDILSDIPEIEYENLGKKSMIILKKLLEVREFTNEGTIEERMKRYEERSNPFDKFWNENVKESPNPDIFITKSEFRRTLLAWCKENRFRELTDKTINKSMSEKNIEEGRATIQWYENERSTDKRVRAWFGIVWKTT